jgi:uncharacterized protein
MTQAGKFEKYRRLQELLRRHKRILVALSGGLDSSFLLYAASEALGFDKCYAAVGISPSLAESEHHAAQEFCSTIGLPSDHLIAIETGELGNPDYRRNLADRCYHCKQELFDKLKQVAAGLGNATILDGATASDIGDHRPGMSAAREAGVESPLLEAGLGKPEIRELAREFGLVIWDKPQSACLASRIPYESEVTAEKLRQIEQAESYLKSLGFTQLRVRHHDKLARIELPPADMARLIENGLRDKIVERFRALGFWFTALDIGGFRSGSMNVMLKGEDND